MRTLFLRFLVGFWLTIGITVGSAALGGFWYSERMREAIDNFDPGDAILDAGTALEADGRAGLVRWLENYPLSLTVNLFVVDDHAKDIRGRRLPHAVQRVFHRHRDHFQSHRNDDQVPGNVRRARHLPLLVSASGDTYTFIVAPSFLPGRLASHSDTRIIIILLAIVVSGLVSYVLARAVSGPVQKLRDATVALADGNLAVRVADSVSKRRDEIGSLGRDFDSMATKLQGAVERQTELSRNISHELRSPLARMRVAIELARRNGGDLPEFARLDNETERLDELIGQILKFTQLDAERSDLPESIDVADVVNEVVENVNYECKSDEFQGVTVSANIKATPMVNGHRDALVSAIENATRNAVVHNPANSAVEVNLSSANKMAVIEILDAGSGVPEDELEKLFEPFFRTRNSVSGMAGGTGLGLAIAARAVELNGGTIKAENRRDGGLAIRIEIPA